MAPIENPVVGDMLLFLLPGHRFYDDFPAGTPVSPYEAFVDFNRAVRVEEVREAWFVVEEQEGRRRRRRRARAPPREALLRG